MTTSAKTDFIGSAPAPADGVATRAKPLAWLVLALLVLTSVLNFMDRAVVQILGQPIKEALGLADWQLGFLSGLAFAAVYTVIGIPLARLAERFNRATIIALCTVVWSVMTAVCGLAANFGQMVLFRMGVGVGEAGSLPASHSLITDYFPPRLRATALAVFGAGIPIGALVGSVLGGFVVDRWGWRMAFLVMGAPGVIVALLVKLLIPETPRGRLDPPTDAAGPPPSALAVARLLWRKASTRQIIAGLTAVVLVGTVSSTFMAPYFVRKFGLSYTEVGLVISATYLIGGIGGNLLGGLLADWAGRKDRRWYAWVPGVGIALSAPLYALAYAQGSWLAAAAILVLPSVISMTYLAPGFAILHNSVEPRMRATMIAMVQLLTNLLGAGLGPILGGLTIDAAAQWLFARSEPGSFAAACRGGLAAAGATPHLAHACHAVLAQATQYTMIAWAPALLWPAAHFLLAARTIRRDAVF